MVIYITILFIYNYFIYIYIFKKVIYIYKRHLEQKASERGHDETRRPCCSIGATSHKRVWCIRVEAVRRVPEPSRNAPKNTPERVALCNTSYNDLLGPETRSSDRLMIGGYCAT